MKSKLYTATLLTVAALVSCAGSDNNDYIDKSIIPTASEKAAAQKAAQNTNSQNQITLPSNAVPGTTMPVNLSQQPQSVNINPQTTTAPGMNPPHGQPGHRCDIAVGAPLNSKPVPTNAQPTTVSTQQPQVTMKEVPNTQKTLPGMNPPHGEPNHRCDIAVGAPLNSKPAPVPTTINTQQTPVTTVSAPQPAQQKTLPGMNPPHGEPNHRCDIAVGAPLNSKPAAPAVAPLQSLKPPPLLAAPKSDSVKN